MLQIVVILQAEKGSKRKSLREHTSNRYIIGIKGKNVFKVKKRFFKDKALREQRCD